jgi:hypothetical protein
VGLFDSGSGIVDIKGRQVRDLAVKGSALIRAQQWIAFLDDWADRLKADEPWVLFMLHATINFHQAFGILARRLRKNRWWTGEMTMEEQTVNLVEDAERRLAWFENESQSLNQNLIPPWARFMFAAIEGGYRMLVRVAKETDQVLKKGHLLIPVDRMGRVVADQQEDNPAAVGAEREQ